MKKNSLVNLVVISFLVLFAASCQGDKNLPTLKTCKDVKISDIGRKNIEIKGELIFDNPNDQTYAYKRSIVEFKINDKDVGSVIDREKLEVLSSQNLKLPFKYSFPFERLEVDTTNPDLLLVKIKGELELINSEQKKITIDFGCEVDIKVKNSLEEKRKKVKKRKLKKLKNK